MKPQNWCWRNQMWGKWGNKRDNGIQRSFCFNLISEISRFCVLLVTPKTGDQISSSACGHVRAERHARAGRHVRGWKSREAGSHVRAGKTRIKTRDQGSLRVRRHGTAVWGWQVQGVQGVEIRELYGWFLMFVFGRDRYLVDCSSLLIMRISSWWISSKMTR